MTIAAVQSISSSVAGVRSATISTLSCRRKVRYGTNRNDALATIQLNQHLSMQDFTPRVAKATIETESGSRWLRMPKAEPTSGCESSRI
jgi:hypothetical protein